MLKLCNLCRGVFCAGNPTNVQSACHGDSGGAMLKFVPNINDEDEQSHFVQIGKFFELLKNIIHYFSFFFEHN
jgi:secreted trypsin-like serine protease